MKKSKLIQFLKSFSKEETRQFSDFLNSPFFNKDKNVLGLWEDLKKYAPEYDTDDLQKEVIYKRLFPNQAFDGKKLGYLMNYLLKQGESFLQVQSLQNDEARKNYYLLKHFNERDLVTHFQTATNKIEKKGLGKAKENANTYNDKRLFAELQDDFLITKTLRKEDNPFLKEAHDHLDQFYFINKIIYCCEMLTRKQIYSTNYDFDITLLDEVESHLYQAKNLPPLLSIYFQIYLMLKEPNQGQHFDKFNEELNRNESNINEKELTYIYRQSINYSARKIRKGEGRFIKIALDTYIKGIENRILFENNILPYQTFINTNTSAIRLEKYDWTETFIHKYYKFLPAHTQRDAFHYSLANLYFQKSEYDKVLENVSQVKLGDMHYSLGARAIFIKTYFELDEVDALLSLLASFTIFLKRNKNISEAWKKIFLNFCQLVNKLIKLKPHKIEKLRKEIETVQPIIDKKWLLEKLKEQEAILL